MDFLQLPFKSHHRVILFKASIEGGWLRAALRSLLTHCALAPNFSLEFFFFFRIMLEEDNGD